MLQVVTNQESPNGWDRPFLDLSSKAAEPFCTAWEYLRFRLAALPLDPQKFDNAATKTQEIARRVLIGLGAALGAILCLYMPLPIFTAALALGLLSKVLRAIGFALQRGGYTHIRTSAPTIALDPVDPQVKVMIKNLCGVGGGMSFDHGGVNPWRNRLDALVSEIEREDPDVLILQEVYDTALAEALAARLEHRYAHIFAHLGPNVWGSVGGGMVFSKCALHKFSHTSFDNNKWTLNRGFATLEIKANEKATQPCARIIGTHLIHGKAPEDRVRRMEQVAQIVNDLAKKTLSLPTLIGGDFNIELGQEEEKAVLAPYLRHGYQGEEPTCTNKLVAQGYGKENPDPEETIDYLSLFKRNLPDGRVLPVIEENIRMEELHLVRSFDERFDTRTATSDHHGMVVTLRGFQIMPAEA